MGELANETGIRLEVSGVCRLTKDAVRLERLPQGTQYQVPEAHSRWFFVFVVFFFFQEQSEKPQDVNSTGALWWSYEE